MELRERFFQHHYPLLRRFSTVSVHWTVEDLGRLVPERHAGVNRDGHPITILEQLNGDDATVQEVFLGRQKQLVHQLQYSVDVTKV